MTNRIWSYMNTSIKQITIQISLNGLKEPNGKKVFSEFIWLDLLSTIDHFKPEF